MHTNVIETIEDLFSRGNRQADFRARQMLFLHSPLSAVVERYLHDNEGNLQDLGKFPMMRSIYDRKPQRLLLKCSRKTLKSTLLSNMITLNMIRYNFYKMLYLGPNEKFTKYFSSNYLGARFGSPAIKKVLIHGLSKDDVFEKILEDTNSSVLLGYASDDATRIRGPATDENIHDEVQDMMFDILPIVKETMALSKFKREIFAGTPLTTDNTINQLWMNSTQCEWFTKCEGCNHWNSLTEDNEPLKMIRIEGISCSKCAKLLDTSKGLWVERNPLPPEKRDLIGYHLAQPILPHFNQDAKEWRAIYRKVTSKDYSVGQIYNEVFGLAYDIGSKPITKEQLMKLCALGPMDKVYEKRKSYYRVITTGVDWGVNMDTSRTAVCTVGLRDDMVCEVFFAKIFRDFNYEKQIRDIANHVNKYQSFSAADSGPDPARGILLGELTNPDKTQLVRYEASQFMQYQKTPADAISWRQIRWCLHRSDTMTFTLNLLKEGKIVFPQFDHVEECLKDILNIFIEVKEGALRQELHYRHPPNLPDDFFHALNFAVIQAYVWAGDVTLAGPSSSDFSPRDFFS